MRDTAFIRWCLYGAVIVGLLMADVIAQSLPDTPPGSHPSTRPAQAVVPGERPAIAGRRVVKHFDFDEQRFGNFDPIPMHWRQHDASGFPQYLEGRFDPKAGHDAAPSFRLDINGGSIGFHYVGRDISVRTNSDYLIVAWCKTTGLHDSRAYLTARYLDRKGSPLPGTERRSELVGGPRASGDWVPLTLGLPGNVPDSRYIGLSLWLTQASVWDTSPRPLRSVEQRDIKGTAWFDDIAVYRLPRVSLRSGHPGNTFRDGEAVSLYAEVSDPDGLNLSAKLAIRAADGRLVEQRSVAIRTTETAPADPNVYRDLPVGAYTAELTVGSDDGANLVRRQLRFLRLAAPISPPADVGQNFGVILRSMGPALLPGQRELLQNLRPEMVKVPVWSPRHAAGLSGEDPAIDRYLEVIAETHADPVGVLMDEMPGEKQASSVSVRPMLELLSEDPLGWKPLVAGLWSRYAGLIHVWQLGDDGDESVFLADEYPRVIPVLYREMKTLMSQPLIASVISTQYSPGTQPLADYDSVMLTEAADPDDTERQLQPFLGKDLAHTWITVEASPEADYTRIERLSGLCRRLAEAYFQKTGAVFMMAPWDVQVDLLSAQVDPREDYIIFRTVADVLGGTTPVSRTTIDGQAHCLLFDRYNRAVAMVWDPYAPPEGRKHVLMLGEDAEQVDLWGNRKRLESLGSRRIVRIGPVPTFIINTPTWLMEFCRQFVLAPPIVDFSFDAYERTVVFRNTYHEPMSGFLRLIAPPDWDVRPNRLPFALQPNEEFRAAVQIRFPVNAEAAVTPLVGEFEIDADRRYRIITPAWFELGLENIDVDVDVYRLGKRAIVQQSMTNRTTHPISFEGYVVAPARRRISRRFVNILPGQSTRKEFVIDDAGDLIGKKIRVGLNELQGSRIWNRIATVP
jgi:hypothetical protein